MKKIKDFKDETSCYKYMVRYNITINKTGRDEEVEVYLSKDGTSVYKLIFYPKQDYRVEKMITTNDLDIELSHYLFPEEIYALNNRYVMAYKNKNINGIPLYTDGVINHSCLKSVDFNTLINSINILINETKILTDRNILISNLKENLVINNDGLYVNDTRGYKKNVSFKGATLFEDIDESLYGDVPKQNNAELMSVIQEILATYFEYGNKKTKCRKNQ